MKIINAIDQAKLQDAKRRKAEEAKAARRDQRQHDRAMAKGRKIKQA